MASPGEFTAGDVLAAADMNDLPGGVLGYAQVTANQASLTSVVDLTGLSVTVDVLASRRIRVTGKAAFFADSASNQASFEVKEDGTIIQETNSHLGIDTSSSTAWHDVAVAVVTPSAGSHTYKLSGGKIVGSGSLTMTAASIRPAFILVEDLGPA